MKPLLFLSGIFFLNLCFSQASISCYWVKNGSQLSKSVLINSISSNSNFLIDSNRFITFLGADSLYVCYSSIPSVFKDTIQEYTQTDVLSFESFEAVRKNNADKSKSPSKIKTYGAISRGLAVGNSGGNGVDSRLNLSLEGQLTDDVSIKAYISDQDIPIQPDGVTQNAQDLDQIYVSLSSKNKELTLGDISLTDSTHFLRYLRNLQGVSFHSNSRDTTFSFNSKVGIGISKGKFYSNTLVLNSGVLGPYKIEGPPSNKFTVVISASEKIFLDGRLLTSGKDYTFDYNQSLVTFLPHILITEYTRVRVDFEYSDLDYFRVNTMAMGEYKNDNIRLKVAYYNEKDNPNRRINTTFSQDDIEILSEVGDNTDGAFINGESEVNKSNSGIWYRKIKVGPEDVFVYTDNVDSAEFEVRFSDVGQGNGDYEIINRELNGLIYGFVGNNLGAYLPLVPVALPHQKKLLITDLSFKLNENVVLGGEIAYSVRDKNRYSRIGDDDNSGYAYNFYYSLSGLKRSKYRLNWLGNVEIVNKNFEQIDRFRTVDFNRDWGTNGLVSDGLLITKQEITFQKDRVNFFTMNASLLDKQKDNSGYSVGLSMKKRLANNVILDGSFELNETTYLSTSSEWQRLYGSVLYTENRNSITLRFDSEHNKTIRDFIHSTSQFYDQVGLNWTNGEKFSINSVYRVDKDTVFGTSELRSRTEALITRVGYELWNNGANLLEVNAIHRHANQRKGVEEQIQGGLIFKNKWKSFFNHKVIYDLSNAQELQREFVFVQVAFGKGSHRFIDFNGDGKQTINEFVEDDIAGDFIKVIVPTNEFIEVYKASLKYRATWDFSEIKWKPLTMFSGQFVFNGSDRTQKKDLLSRLLPVKGDSSRAYNQHYLAEIYFHRGIGVYEFYYRTQDYDVFNQYLRGEDQRGTKVNTLGMRNQLNTFTLDSYFEWGIQSFNTNITANNNYVIKSHGLKEECSRVFNRKLRFTLLGSYHLKRGIQLPEATFFELGMRSRLIVNEVGLNSSFSFVGINHNAPSTAESTQEGFVILDGLSKGSNYRWSFNLQKKLSKSIQLNLSYQGRKPHSQKIFHIGRMQATAYF